MLRIIGLLICLLLYRPVFAGDKKPMPGAVLMVDTTNVAQRHLDTAALNAYRKLPEFEYRETYSGPSLWTRFWRWFWSLFQIKDPKKISVLTVVIKYFFIAAGLAAILFIILKLTGVNPFLFRRKPQHVLAYTESQENIHEIDFDAEIEKAIAVQNYRYAVRLLYLKSLKQLSDAGLINWQLNKTNYQYITELTDSRNREEFKQLTLQFEYVWYGDFLINSEVFKRINALFQSFRGGKA